MSNEEGLSDPYSDIGQNLTPETPTFGTVLTYALHQQALGLRVALPCRITAVHGNQLVDVQPLIMSRYVSTQAASPLPVLVNTLVAMPMGQDYAIKLPLAVGDLGYCIFCDRSLDNWASGAGDAVDPQDSRAHDLTDGVFYPGLTPVAKQGTDTTTDLVLTNGQAQIRLQKDGRVQLANGQFELLRILDDTASQMLQLLSTLQSAVILTPIGPGSIAAVTQAQLQTVQNAVTQLQQNLETLKGGAP